jgi:23S rRNA (pseudouridine1915-N3)-methyltransferase
VRVTLAAIGRLKDGGERDLADRYASRFDQSGRQLALGPVSLIELPESRRPEASRRRSEEATRLLAVTDGAAARIVLDEAGRMEGSGAFARRLAMLRDSGAVAVAFLIGGPDGHGEAALAAATVRLSLGSMTLPHGLARVVLLEQLYRATTILAGHPYHRQ